MITAKSEAQQAAWECTARALKKKTHAFPCLYPPEPNFESVKTSASPNPAGRGEMLSWKLDRDPVPPTAEELLWAALGEGRRELALKQVQNFYYLGLDHLN